MEKALYKGPQIAYRLPDKVLTMCPEYTDLKWWPGADKSAGSRFGARSDPNEVRARAMDGPQPQICREKIWTHVVRPQGAAQGRAASILHRHADFQ